MPRYIFISLLLTILVNPFIYGNTPSIQANKIIFYYQNDSAQTVRMLTSIDDYRKSFIFIKTDKDSIHKGKWLLELDLTQIQFQLKPGKYFYKLIVDNIATIDPENPYYEIDPYIGAISYFEVKEELIAFNKTPEKIGKLTYRFYFKKNSISDQIDQIEFLGSFNSFQPGQYFLKQAQENIWYIDFQFDKPGTYYYQFRVNGKNIPDPFNKKRVYTKLGDAYSVAEVQ